MLDHSRVAPRAQVVVAYVAMADIDDRILSRELKKGSAEPVTYAAAVGVTLLAAAVASYVPARRAASVDPIETLKAE